MEKFTVVELKAMLKEKGLNMSGNKSELIQRLQHAGSVNEPEQQAADSATEQACAQGSATGQQPAGSATEQKAAGSATEQQAAGSATEQHEEH